MYIYIFYLWRYLTISPWILLAQLDILWHHGDAFAKDGTKICIIK